MGEIDRKREKTEWEEFKDIFIQLAWDKEREFREKRGWEDR